MVVCWGWQNHFFDANVTLKDSAGAAIAHTFFGSWCQWSLYIDGHWICKWIINWLNGVVSQTEASWHTEATTVIGMHVKKQLQGIAFCEGWKEKQNVWAV
jgi:hypothetical protein